MNKEEIELRIKIEEHEKRKAECDKNIGRLKLQLLKLNKKEEEIIKEESVKTETGYPIIFINQNCGHIPIINDVKEDGTLVFQRNHKSSYSMYELVVLDTNMRTITGTKIYSRLAKLIGVSEYTVRRLTKGIATGKYDKLFKKWFKVQDKIMFDEYGQMKL